MRFVQFLFFRHALVIKNLAVQNNIRIKIFSVPEGFFTKHKCSSDYLRCQMIQIRQGKYASADFQQIFKGENLFFSH